MTNANVLRESAPSPVEFNFIINNEPSLGKANNVYKMIKWSRADQGSDAQQRDNI